MLAIMSTAKTNRDKRVNIVEIAGWLGMIFTLGAYALLSIGILNGDNPVYHLIVFIGALGLAILTFVHKTYQPFIVNVVFMLLAFIALIRIVYFI